MADIQKTVTDLNAGWYNIVNKALSLDPTTFQLAQGALGLQTSDSSGLFLMADATPPPSAVAYYDAGGMLKRSSVIRMLLHALKGEAGSDLRDVLKDKYADWATYRNADNSDLSQFELFKKWANRHLDPGLATQAVTVFKEQASSPLNAALDAMVDTANRQTFLDSADGKFQLYRYKPDIAAAQAAIAANSRSADITFDSASMDTTLDHVWTSGSASGLYKIFSGGVSGSFDQLNQTATGNRITIKGRIGQYTTLAVSPIGWFPDDEFKRAFDAKGDNAVWDPLSTAGSWDSFFAQPNGSLARRVSELVLVSDYQLTVTSHATYTQDDVRKIEAAVEFGIWPLFKASAKGGSTTEHHLNQDGTLSVTYSLPKNSIQIWGVNVLAAPH